MPGRRSRVEAASVAGLAGLAAAMLAIGCGVQPDTAGREHMIDAIRSHHRANSAATGRPELDPRVVAAMREVPRHEFVPAEARRAAYDDRPLPIGHGQTISQPYIVALMTDLAEIADGGTVLEIGTGSGYQAAILAQFATRVYTIEIVPELAAEASATLTRLGYTNVETRVGDGYQGWPEHAPFDAILVTAAPEHIPTPLIEQLKPGGKLVIPVGPQRSAQELIVLEKSASGETTERRVMPVAFVPLTGAR